MGQRLLERRADVLRVLHTVGLDSHRASNVSVIELRVVGPEIGNTLDHHFELDHAQRGVVENHHLDGQLVELHRQQLTHQHGEPAIAGHRNDLALTVSSLCADRLRQSIRHGPVAVGRQQTTVRAGHDVARVPHVAHTGVGREDGVVVGQVVQVVCQEFRVNRRVLGDVLGVRRDDVLQVPLLLLEHGIKEAAVGLFLQQGEQLRHGGLHVTNNRVFDVGASADVSTVNVDLRSGRRRQEVGVGEVGTDQDQEVSIVECCSTCTVTEEAGHTDVIRVVVVQNFLTGVRVADRRLNLLRDGEELIASTGATDTAEHCHLVSLVDGVGKVAELLPAGVYFPVLNREVAFQRRGLHGLLHGDVTREGHDRHTVTSQGRLDGGVNTAAGLSS